MNGQTRADGSDTASLVAMWTERMGQDAEPDSAALRLLEQHGALFGALVASQEDALADGDERLARGAGDRSGQARASFAFGRAAHGCALDLPGLIRVLGQLHDCLMERAFRVSCRADGPLQAEQAVAVARGVRTRMSRSLAAAGLGWSEEAGRRLRHDVMTPLQATSLNLELLALDSVEQGIDGGAFETIQGSLDEVVKLLARA